jgi:hypothetical protein
VSATVRSEQRPTSQVFGIPDRTWNVLDARFGYQEQRTLDEIGREYGLSRERIRQIQAKGTRRLEQAFRTRNVRDTLREADNLLRPSAGPPAIASLGPLLGLSDSDWKMAILAVRSLIATGRKGLVGHYPRLSLAACRISPAIAAHPDVARQIAASREAAAAARYRPTYLEAATMALRKAKGPLHWREILAYADDVLQDVNAGPFYNVLTAHPQQFVRVGAGTYGLSEWNLASVSTFPDLIAQTLRDAHAAMTFEQVLAGVAAKRSARPNSIRMFLDMHPRFYASPDGRYGLRAWLPLPAQQTLRTPRDLVEAASSRARIERARRRGYDIEAMVALDNE